LERRLYADHAGSKVSGAAAGGVLAPLAGQVRPEWIDYNGHMTDSRYLQVFGDATDALFRYAGIDDGYRKAGHGMYTAETHMTHQAEARVNEQLYVASRVLFVDEKRVRLFHTLNRARDGVQLGTCEQLYLHVDTAAGRVAPMNAAVLGKLTQVLASQAGMPPPAEAGRLAGKPAR
jgi:carnitine 3-dehydrogenase